MSPRSYRIAACVALLGSICVPAAAFACSHTDSSGHTTTWTVPTGNICCWGADACENCSQSYSCQGQDVCIPTAENLAYCDTQCPPGTKKCESICCNPDDECVEGQCVPPPPPDSCKMPKVGDPVQIRSGASSYAHTDVTLRLPTGDVSFTRKYTSREEQWRAGGAVSGVPKPFGSAPGNDFLEWWHDKFAFVHATETSWNVWDGETMVAFPPCSGSTCVTHSQAENYALPDWLERTSNGFALHRVHGGTMVFESPFAAINQADGGAYIDRFFLTRQINEVGATEFEIDYALPSNLTGCPAGHLTNGVPYIGKIRYPGGSLRFDYEKIPNAPPTNTDECVLYKVILEDELADGGTGSETVAAFEYTRDTSSNERSGRLASVVHGSEPDPSELYQYTSTGMVKSDRAAVGTHTYGTLANGKEAVISAMGGGWDLSFSRDAGIACQSGSNCCGNTLEAASVIDNAAGRGDGNDGGAGLLTTYEVLPNSGGSLGGRLYRSVDSCSVTNACSPGSKQYEWSCNEDGGLAHELAEKDKRDDWTAYSWGTSDPDAGSTRDELRSVMYGATDMNGTDYLERVDYTYAYGDGGVQLRVVEERDSVIETGGKARVVSQFDPVSNRRTGTIRSGWTRVSDEGSENWSDAHAYYATFERVQHTFGSNDGPDDLGRVLEMEGPCSVGSETATSCATVEDVPLTQYFYYPADAGTNLGNRLQKVRRWTSRSGDGGTYLDNDYLAYDAWGHATRTSDENGVVTVSTFNGNQLASQTVGTGSNRTVNFGYDHGQLAWKQFRSSSGSYEVYCYREGATGGCTATSTALTDKLQWKAMASDSDGASWSEKVEYSYWPDGTVKDEQYFSWNGTSAELRKQVHYAADAHHRPVRDQVGTGTSSFATASRFDGADNLEARGFAYNSPAAWCKATGNTHDPACALMAYDHANRLTSLDEFPSSGNSQRTNFRYDVHGNVTEVKTGCTTTDDIDSCTAPSLRYVYDDFGRLVEAALPWESSGDKSATRYQYDASDNVVLRQTYEALANGQGGNLTYTYDLLSRLRTAESADQGLLYELVYDVDGPDALPTDCPSGLTSQPGVNTMGRLRERRDSFGQTWLSYDQDGHVIAEVRIRAPATSCNVDADTNPHTFYTYVNGELGIVEYPYGRMVRYSYGTGALAQRIIAISVSVFDGSSWTLPSSATIDNVTWEPYGGLRGYKMRSPTTSMVYTLEYALGDDPTSAPTCSGSAPTMVGTDMSGRLRELRISNDGNTNADIYQRWYQWQADQVVRTDTCLVLSGTTYAPITETYAYDRTLRLASAGRNSQTIASNGGAFESRSYGYDSRGNRTSLSEDGVSSTVLYETGSRFDQLASVTSSADAARELTYQHDADGRVYERTSAKLLRTSQKATLDFTYGVSSDVSTDTVFGSVSVNGSAWNYFYDSAGRRRLKVSPTGAETEFFYDTNNQMILDTQTQSGRGEDSYVWLDGRPVLVVRGYVSRGSRVADSTSACNRSEESGTIPCGARFIVTDHIAKPVAIFDDEGRLANAYDYDPFGYPNRVTKVAGTSHAYTNNISPNTVTTLVQPALTSESIDLRVHFAELDTEISTLTCGTAPRTYPCDTIMDPVTLADPDNSNASLGVIGGSSVGTWTDWVTPTAGRVALRFESNGANCCPGHTTYPTDDGLCATPGCSSGSNFPYDGFVVDSYEYRRYSAGAAPFSLPIRFPGQYHDAETDLFENWNRYYDPAVGSYLEPEPRAKESIRQDVSLLPLPLYSYAANSPLGKADVDGRQTAIAGGAVVVGGLAVLIMTIAVNGHQMAKTANALLKKCDKADDECDDGYNACVKAGGERLRGNNIGETRCGSCKAVCQANGGKWPSSIPSPGGSVRAGTWQCPGSP